MPRTNGWLIRRRRIELDLSTAELAAEVGLVEGSLRNIEGRNEPASLRLINRLARRIGMDPGLLVQPEGNNGGVPDTPPQQPKSPKKDPGRKEDRTGRGPRRPEKRAS
jgi:transcriptional regulator with XRE-family HTH domain